MKKIVSLAIACMLLLSCFAINAFAAEAFTFTATEADADGVFALVLNAPSVSANDNQGFKNIKLAFSFDSSKVQLLNKDKTAVTTTKTSSAFTADALNADLPEMASGNKYSDTVYDTSWKDFTYTLGQAGEFYAGGSGEVLKIYFKKVGNIAEADAPITMVKSNSPQVGAGWRVDKTFGNGISATLYGSTTKYQLSDDTATVSFNFANIVDKVEEPAFSATATGTTITCAGKVEATVSNYGVEFTTNKVGTRAQKYYGAMPGDKVSDGNNGVITFDFDGWDGTFEIILEGVTKGEKTLNFFANDTVIENTTFTVVAE